MASLWKCLNKKMKWALPLLIIATVQLANAQSNQSKKIVFKKVNIQLADKKLNVELAETQEQHEQGLMFRKNLGANDGMLFIFNDEDIRYFWMKNTFIDLSIGYFDSGKTLVDIQEMKAVTSLMEERPPTYPSKKPAKYALEMPKNWFTKNKIKTGAKLKVL